jgi:hypothetical protein
VSENLQQDRDQVQLRSLLSRPDFKERFYGERSETTPKRSSTVKVSEVSTPMQAYKHSTPKQSKGILKKSTQNRHGGSVRPHTAKKPVRFDSSTKKLDKSYLGGHAVDAARERLTHSDLNTKTSLSHLLSRADRTLESAKAYLD